MVAGTVNVVHASAGPGKPSMHARVVHLLGLLDASHPPQVCAHLTHTYTHTHTHRRPSPTRSAAGAAQRNACHTFHTHLRTTHTYPHAHTLQAISPGQQLVLSYGERSSDDFFVHYGFVPPLCNPHEVWCRCRATPVWHGGMA